MRLVVDTDIFCKLGAADLLGDAIGLFNAKVDDCCRLPALPHMLRKGRLRKTFGDEISDTLIPCAESMPFLHTSGNPWLEALTPVDGIDVGEAQLLAAAAENGLFILTGDKRALRSLKNVEGFGSALAGRIVLLEAVLLALCDRRGTEVIRRQITPLEAKDTMFRICFSPGNPDPMEALLSYYRSSIVEFNPLVLWNPRIGG